MSGLGNKVDRIAIIIVVVSALLAANPSEADELHLRKSVIEGDIVAETAHAITIETLSGELLVPVSVVTRRVIGPTRYDRYLIERDRASLTPARHLEVAAWCREADLPDLARHHVDAALEAEPQNEAALRAAGYVQLGGLWLKAGASRSVSAPNADTAALVERLVEGWAPSFTSIRDQAFAAGASGKDAAVGRAALRTIRSPLAIPSACRALGGGGVESRQALAEFLGTFDDDVALLNLFVLALMDPHAPVRGAANGELLRRADGRMTLFLRMALRCEVETMVRRSADTLGRLGDKSAVDDLIAVLPAGGIPGTPMSLRELFGQLETMLSQPTLVPLRARPFEYTPIVAVPGYGRNLVDMGRDTTRAPGGFRSYVQDALIAITGENYGFDIAAWKDWAAHNVPARRTAP